MWKKDQRDDSRERKHIIKQSKTESLELYVQSGEAVHV